MKPDFENMIYYEYTCTYTNGIYASSKPLHPVKPNCLVVCTSDSLTLSRSYILPSIFLSSWNLIHQHGIYI